MFGRKQNLKHLCTASDRWIWISHTLHWIIGPLPRQHHKFASSKRQKIMDFFFQFLPPLGRGQISIIEPGPPPDMHRSDTSLGAPGIRRLGSTPNLTSTSMPTSPTDLDYRWS